MNRESEKARDKSAPRLVLILFGVTVVVAALLGLVNHITKDAIAEGKAAKTSAAMREVLPADDYTEIDIEGKAGDIVTGLYEAETDGAPAGWVVLAAPTGFGGTISMVVGIDASGAVTGVSITAMSETSGLGANALKEDFRAQYRGKSGSVALSKYGGGIDALTGATITSEAVTQGVNAALKAVAAISKGG